MKVPSFLQPVWQAHWVCLFWFKNTPIHKCFPLLTFYTHIHKHTFCYVVYDFMHTFFFVVVSHSFSIYKLNCDLDDQGNGSLMYTRKLTATNDTKNKTLTCNSKSNFILNYNFQKNPNWDQKAIILHSFFFWKIQHTLFLFFKNSNPHMTDCNKAKMMGKHTLVNKICITIIWIWFQVVQWGTSSTYTDWVFKRKNKYVPNVGIH